MRIVSKVPFLALCIGIVIVAQISAQACCVVEAQSGNNPALTDYTLINFPPEKDFTVPTLGGEDFTLSDHFGKPVVIYAMAYWCPTCIPEAKALALIYQEYGDSVVILALDVDPNSTPEALSTFRSYVDSPGYYWGFDIGGKVVQAYNIRALETTIIFDRQGEIVYTDARSTRYRTLDKVIKPLLEN